MAIKIDCDETYDKNEFDAKFRKFAKLNGIDISNTVGEGDAFELFVATVFKFNGYKIDEIVGRSGDQGGDIIVKKGVTKTETTALPFTFGAVTETKKTGSQIKYCIQCKYHSTGNEGNKAITEAALGKKKHKCNEGIAVASTDFTSGGYEAAKLEKISTINGSQLTTMIKKASKKQDPWTYVWSNEDLVKIGFI